ncbi:MAG: penicillin-binding protein [Actinomycetota bacterium]|nr:penicillin-binding protein [Actinomycetota bacterium]
MRATRRLGSVLTLLVAMLATAMVMGLLAAGLLIPAVGGVGIASNKSIELFNGLPGTFAMNPLAQQSRILAADGSTIATPFNENRIVVPLSKVAPIMRKAQVAIEDERFYQHGGIDPKGLLRAVASNAQGGGTQGASTLTQQYVKVALQNQAIAAGNTKGAKNAVAREGLQGYVRKLQELKYATSLEQKYSKDQILDGYLNIVYFGDQQYGIEAASQHYFSVHAAQLTLPQAALLAGVVNQPTTFDPVTNPKNSEARRNIVLQKMYQQKIITFKQYSDASVIPVPSMLKLKNISGNCSSSKYPYFCNYVTDWLYQQPALGKNRTERQAALKSGGLTIKTSFQPKMAATINAQLRKQVTVGNKDGIDGAGVIIQPGTGYILGMGQTTTFSNSPGAGKSAINFNAPPDLGGSQVGFDFGSAAKLFAIVTALERGASSNDTIDVRPQINLPNGNGNGTNFRFSDFNGPCYTGRGTWPVENDFPVPVGPMTYATAAAWSVNTAFAKLVSDIGLCNVVATMKKLGLTSGGAKLANIGPSGIVLGTNGVAPVNLANAYATVAAGGKYCPPRPVVSITDGNGKSVSMSGIACRQVMSAKVAAETTKVFQAVLNPDDPKATAHASALANGRPAAGKTGTETGANNIWFVGFTPQLATAVWVGHGSGNPRNLKYVTLGGKYYDTFVFAGDVAAPIWKGIMDAALKGEPNKDFPAVPGFQDNPTGTPSNSSSGATAPSSPPPTTQ